MKNIVRNKFGILLVCAVLILCQCLVIAPLFAKAETKPEVDEPKAVTYEPMKALVLVEGSLYEEVGEEAEEKVQLPVGTELSLLSAKLVDEELWYYVECTYIEEGDETPTIISGYIKAVYLKEATEKALIDTQTPVYLEEEMATYSKEEDVEVLTTSLVGDVVWCQILFAPELENEEEVDSEVKVIGSVEAASLTFVDDAKQNDADPSISTGIDAEPSASIDVEQTPEPMLPSPTSSVGVDAEPISSDPQESETIDEEPIASVEVPQIMTFAVAAAAVDPFEQSLANFPSSYHAALREMHYKYPNWTFEAVKASMSWDTQLSRQLSGSTSLIWKTASAPYIDQSDKDSSGNQKTYDGGSWYKASEAAVRYYLDPRNFLTEDYVFMFESLQFNSSHTVAGVQAILNDSFAKAQAQNIYNAGSSQNVNAYHLASRIRLEQGTNGNGLAHGTVTGTFSGDPNYFTGYFNYFNIGAYEAVVDGQTLKPTQRGAWYARGSGNGLTSYGRPWTTAAASITGGAQFLNSGYIGIGQNTSYSQKFNTVGSASHQYMTNVQAPSTEATKTKNAYPDLNATIHFKIPVYDNMPAVPAFKPGTNVPTPTHTINWALSGGYIHQIPIGTAAATILAKTTVANGTSDMYTQTGTPLSPAARVGTGHSFRVYDIAWTQRACYYIVIYGDLTSDGVITTADLVASRKHLLGTGTLSGAYLKAGDFNGDGAITMADHIRIRKYLLGMQDITQY